MLYAIMRWDGLLRFGVRAIRETRELAEEDSRNLYWVSVVEDDGRIGSTQTRTLGNEEKG